MNIRRAICFSACLFLLSCSNEPGAPSNGGTNPNNGPRTDAGNTVGADTGTGTGNPNVPDLPLGAGVRTLAGAAESGTADGPRGTSRFNNPANVAVGPDGRIFVADYDNGLIRVLRGDGQTSTFTRQANFTRPFGLVFASDGTLYAQTDSDDMGGRSYTTGTLWRVARDGQATPLVRGLGRPRGLAALGDGRIVMADPEHHTVRVFNPANLQVTPLAGALDQPGYADGAGDVARFNRPYDIVVVGDRIVVADQNNHRLRAVTLAGVVSTVAGAGVMGTADGPAMTARFNRPQALARDGVGNLYVTDMDGYVVRRVAPDGTVSTVAGAGRAGFQDGELMEARFFGLEGMDVTPDGAYLYIADGNRGGTDANHRVRRVATGVVPGVTPEEQH